MNRIQGTLTAIGVAMLVTLGVSCGGDPTPEPDVPTSPPPASAPGVTTAPPVPSTGEATTAPPAPAPASASRAPGATSVKEFAFGWPRGGADVIVVATISSVLAEKLLGPYGEDGTALPAECHAGEVTLVGVCRNEETGNMVARFWPITDYLVQIESVLKADDVVAGADTLVLRMFGYLSRQGQGPAGFPITVGQSLEMPKPGDHLLFILRWNPDGTYGTGPAGLLNIDGATVAFADGYRFPFEMAPAQFMDEIRDAVSRIISYKGTVASRSSSTLVLVVDGDELTFDITGAKIQFLSRGDLAQDAEVKIEAEDSPDGLVAITVNVLKGVVEEEDEEEEEGEPGGEVLQYEGTVASFSSSKLVLVVDGDELTFDITGAEIDGTLANDAKVHIEAEDSPDGLVAITVSVFQVPKVVR